MSKTKEPISEALEFAKIHFENGTRYEREDFSSKKEYEKYLEYLQYGPRGFWEEFHESLDFDSFFEEEYGGDW